VAVVCAGGFVVVERHQAQPLVRLELLRVPSLRSAGALTFLVGLWVAGEMLVLSYYLQGSLHDSALFTGLAIAPQGVVGFTAGFFGARLSARLGIRKLLVLTGAAATSGFLILAHLPASGSYSPALIAVVLVGFGTAGTAFGATVMGTAAMADADQGLIGGVINTTRQVGAAIGAALLLAIADGGRGADGVATVVADRHAMVAGAIAAVLATVVAWRSGRPAIQPRNSLVQITVSRSNHVTDRAWDASICD
jgi:predicted MFS family arabinose efflux permease